LASIERQNLIILEVPQLHPISLLLPALLHIFLLIIQFYLFILVHLLLDLLLIC